MSLHKPHVTYSISWYRIQQCNKFKITRYKQMFIAANILLKFTYNATHFAQISNFNVVGIHTY